MEHTTHCHKNPPSSFSNTGKNIELAINLALLAILDIPGREIQYSIRLHTMHFVVLFIGGVQKSA